MKRSTVGTMCFRQGYSCEDIAAIVRQTLFIAYRWGLPLILGSADIATAFDTMEHETLGQSLLGRGAHPDLARALLREVSCMTCRVNFPCAGQSEAFPLEHGGKQGGVETPEEFNIMTEHALEPIVSA